MKIIEWIEKKSKKDLTDVTKQMEALSNSSFKMKKTWPFGFISFIGFPALTSMLSGKEYSTLALLTLFALVFFIPERHKFRHLEITDLELKYYRENPDEIALINNATKIRYKYLSYAFILGFILVVVSKLIGPMFSKIISVFWAEVLRDFSFEIGVALWGGAITTYIIELHAKKEEEDCKRKQAMLRKLLELDE